MRILLGFALSAALATSAAALDLATVGERYDGYLGTVGKTSEAVRREVAAINIKRRALYSDMAARRGVSPEEIGITAGCTTMARVPVGGLYYGTQGGWQRRAAGQPAPVPAYCRQ